MIARVLGVVLSAVGLIALAVLWLTHAPAGAARVAFVVACVWGHPAHAVVRRRAKPRDVGQRERRGGRCSRPRRSFRATANVGVLITDAEELALAGARAWSRVARAANRA